MTDPLKPNSVFQGWTCYMDAQAFLPPDSRKGQTSIREPRLAHGKEDQDSTKKRQGHCPMDSDNTTASFSV